VGHLSLTSVLLCSKVLPWFIYFHCFLFFSLFRLLISSLSISVALSSERSYYGVPAFTCEKCGALFWYMERSKRSTVGKGHLPIFHGCCLRGKVSLSRFNDWPSPLKELLSYGCGLASAHFHHLIAL
jgi:hypothetical protein